MCVHLPLWVSASTVLSLGLYCPSRCGVCGVLIWTRAGVKLTWQGGGTGCLAPSQPSHRSTRLQRPGWPHHNWCAAWAPSPQGICYEPCGEVCAAGKLCAAGTVCAAGTPSSDVHASSCHGLRLPDAGGQVLNEDKGITALYHMMITP